LFITTFIINQINAINYVFVYTPKNSIKPSYWVMGMMGLIPMVNRG